MNSNNGDNEQQELLEKALFSYIGYHHVQNLNEGLDANRDWIETIEIARFLDRWFYELNSNLSNKYRNIFRKVVNKAAVIFLVLAVLITVLTVSVDALRVGVFNLIMKSTEKYLGVKVEEKDSTKDDISLKEYYVLNYIPEGFELDSVEKYGKTIIITYTNENDQKILFNQASNDTSFKIDSEDSIKRI